MEEQGNASSSTNNTPVLSVEEKKAATMLKLNSRLQKDEQKGIIIDRQGISPLQQQSFPARQSFQPVATTLSSTLSIQNTSNAESQATVATLEDNILPSPQSHLNFDPQRSLIEPEGLNVSNHDIPHLPESAQILQSNIKSEVIDLVIIDSSPSRSNSSIPGRSRDGPPTATGKKRGKQIEDTSSNGGAVNSIPFRSDSIDHSNDFNAKKSPKLDKMDSPNHHSDGASKNTLKMRNIVSYFMPNKDTPASKEIVTITPIVEVPPASSDTMFLESNSAKSKDGPPANSASAKQKPITTTAPANTNVMKEMQNSINELKKQLDGAKLAKDQVELKAQRLEADIKIYADRTKALEERNAKLMKSLEEVYRKMAQQEFRRTRDRLALDNVRLGKISSHRTGPQTFSEVWEEGYSMKELNKRNAELIARKEELEARKKRVAAINKKRTGGKRNSGGGIGEELTEVTSAAAEVDLELDVLTEQETIRAHLEQLKRDEMALAEERRLLESEKAIHIKELKRTQCEERSRFFRDLPCFNNRYLLQSLLGRGGFSEVWKAFDLAEIREVAVKIHQLNPQWSEERKSSYIKHVTREYNIHREMKHARVVQLYDVFEIDLNSFATVLEYCKGIDLDEKLKRLKTLPEKDAKAILMQIFGGLRYLNRPLSYSGMHSGSGAAVEGSSSTNAAGEAAGLSTPNNVNPSKRRSIIHYDLKPANILFDEMGDVKITDFGLAKIIDETNEGTSMELTSQGAGTYWYLPPECFDKGHPRISSKVDVWSAGVVFFQMLFGYRPFGEGKTQENVWSENIIYNSSQVEFPTDPKAPKVSEEAKDLIRACLTKDQRLRPDIDAIWSHPYFRK